MLTAHADQGATPAQMSEAYRAVPARDAAAYLSEDAFSTKRHLENCIAIYGNGYDDIRASAIEAIASGRAAFWTTSTYSAARTVDLPLALNRGVGIREALEQAFPAWCADRREAAMETIVPLNTKAVNALALAYAQISGSFFEDAELEARRMRDCRRAVA
ncbi:MAG: hypothetical protein EOQ41_16055 [Mesorhizobium sp.]|nr:hypothetical protein [Mesorhizobium sp.]RWB29623.1 MAG: hypothetical protein EOQ41_16055 [Mesorhizobium sp.]